MNYYGATINDSSTIAEKTGAEITDGAFKVVKYDTNGDVVLCSVAGEVALGVILPEVPATIAKGDDVTVQIKNIGMAISGAEIAKGDMVAVDANAKVQKATAGQYYMGVAMQKASAADAYIKVDFSKSGYVAN